MVPEQVAEFYMASRMPNQVAVMLNQVVNNISGRTQVLYKARVLYCALFSRSCFFFSGNC